MKPQGKHRLTKEFLADLESVLATDASEDVPIGDLKHLGEVLHRCSELWDHELKSELSKLPTDHPVKCPISLYGVMEMGRLEVAHTRTLAWMLNPSNIEHGFKDLLSKAFLRHICKCVYPSSFRVEDVEAERIYRNTFADDAGRTDIWIEGSCGGSTNSGRWLVVIEAKIGASEGDQQLRRYNAEIKKWRAENHGGHVYRIFLTTDGRPPTSGDRWQVASFSRLAHVFWDAARYRTNTSGYHFLRYYLAGVLRDVMGLPIGGDDRERDPYKLLAFLKESKTGI